MGCIAEAWARRRRYRPFRVQLNLLIDAPLYTAGYQGRTPDALIRLMQKHGITQLIDVREHPVSRRPGFGRKALSAAVTAAGLTYVHLREAGNPFRKELQRGQYDAHLDAHPEIVAQVADTARRAPSVLLCFERDPEHCHRTALARRVAAALQVPLEAL